MRVVADKVPEGTLPEELVAHWAAKGVDFEVVSRERFDAEEPARRAAFVAENPHWLSADGLESPGAV